MMVCVVTDQGLSDDFYSNIMLKTTRSVVKFQFANVTNILEKKIYIPATENRLF